MEEKKRIPFEMLFATCETRIHAIFTFLAMLELIQQKYLGILIGTGRNNFIVEWNPDHDAPVEDIEDTLKKEAALNEAGESEDLAQ
jgi:segregation and condensation protein A